MSESLPVEITRTGIWQRTLARQEGDIDSAARSRLRNAFIMFRERAETLSKEISRDLPEFTVHDITHIDALWELADLIIGLDYYLTPAEAFVLGGIFLIHDLGMGLAAYPVGKEDLRKNDHWNDTITYFLKEKLGRFPTKEEIETLDEDTENKAIGEVLRILHAERAEELAFVEWKDESSSSTTYHLIEDPEIRNIYGVIIGKIAHSHWWPVKRLDEEFKIILGAPSIFPSKWSVDPLKLACILRLADASHLDSSRAPGFLKALRKPSNYSNAHWRFQENLSKPRVESDRLLYTSGNSFSIDDFDAWWLCYDTLRMVDRELGEVDALLADRNKPRFCVRSVAGIEDPDRLERLIPTKGWVPVDASIKVSNVSSLVHNLGGEQLYGKDNTIPLRELIQNSVDAIKARRIVENRPDDWGDIIVRSGKESENYWIEVEDNGIGMSLEVLKGPLLDFGISSWGSQLMREEHPGLLAKGFQSIGRFGIGFFSVFMLGKHVQVTTRRYDYGQQETLVLEFSGGVESRPILREAKRNEYLRDGGTRIRVWLNDQLEFSIPNKHLGKKLKITDICLFIAPSIDVNLYVQEGNSKSKKVISASDWITLNNNEFVSRILTFTDGDKKLIEKSSLIAENLRLLKNDNGEIVGRACIIRDESLRSETYGYITIGGFFSCYLRGFIGILAGTPVTASRNIALPIVNVEELRKWATEQSELIGKIYSDPERLFENASMIRFLGGDTVNLPITYSSEGWKNTTELSKWAKNHDEVILLSDHYYKSEKKKFNEFKLNSNVLIINSLIPFTIENFDHFDPRISFWPPATKKSKSFGDWITEKQLKSLIIENVANSWSVSLEEITLVPEFSDDNDTRKQEIGIGDGKVVIQRVNDIILNPRKNKDKNKVSSKLK